MATLEDELKDLKEKNNELAQKVQYWKMTAAERENEKLNLMKEMNELRLKLSRLRNTGGYKACKLDASIQQAGEKAISYLVDASSEIARSIEIAKAYMRERQELDAQSPRWSSLGGTPAAERTDKVHRVPPMMMGGQSIQPVVALSRTLLNTGNPRTGTRSPTQNRSITERAVPMHMLQDVYIPLTRIDVSDLPNNNMEADAEEEADNADDANDSAQELGLEDGEDRLDDSARISEEDDEFSGRQLHTLSEEESEIEEGNPPRVTVHIDNPLEGPSWLLDSPPNRSSNQSSGGNLEPDSTTEPVRTPATPTLNIEDNVQKESSNGVSVRVSCEFSPTVRRRKRTSSPPPLATPHQHLYSPRPASSRKNSMSGRVLKVLVAKMRLEPEGGGEGSGGGGEGGGGGSPAKRARSPLLTFDAPSPNGATDSAVIVSETRTHPLKKEIKTEPDTALSRRDSHEALRCRINSLDSRTSHQSPLSQETHEPRNKPNKPENHRKTNNQDGHVRGRLLSESDSVQRSRVGGSHESRDSDSGSGGGGDSISEGRTRRPRKNVTYKEKPLNRKLRR